jgi:hypothetical protein
MHPRSGLDKTFTSGIKGPTISLVTHLNGAALRTAKKGVASGSAAVLCVTAGGIKKAPAVKKRAVKLRPEAAVRDALAASIPGSAREVPCSSGFVDIVTPTELIEVKRAQLWKGGLGQVLVYSKDFPGLSPRLHLFGQKSYEHFALAHATCVMFGVRVTTDEEHEAPPAPQTPLAPQPPLAPKELAPQTQQRQQAPPLAPQPQNAKPAGLGGAIAAFLCFFRRR